MSKSKIAAAIEIGSRTVQMRISQWNGYEIVPLDKLEKPVQIGNEVFSTGYISFDTVRALSEILNGFSEKAREYEIPSVHAIATTALREASNQAYVLDHLSIRSKLVVNVLEDTQSSALLIDAMKNSDYIPSERMLLVYSGTGSTDFALIKDEKTAFSHSIQTGLLKIAEILREASDFSLRIDRVADEYLYSFLTRENRMADLLGANGLVFGTGDMHPLYKLYGVADQTGTMKIPGKEIIKIYESCRPLSMGQLCERHDLSRHHGEVLFAMLSLLSALVRLTKVKNLFCTQISLADAMLNQLLAPYARKNYNESLRAGAISSALDLAARYRSNTNHCQHVADMALFLFDNLKGIHGLSKKQSLILHVACILHEAGYYTNTADLREASFDLVKDAQIYGFHSRETLLAANIIAPQSLLGVIRGGKGGGTLGSEDVLFAAKMHALLHLADTLDYSRRQKATLSGAALEGDRLILTAQVREDFTLERCMFKQSALLFQEIFGIVPQLNIDNMYYTS